MYKNRVRPRGSINFLCPVTPFRRRKEKGRHVLASEGLPALGLISSSETRRQIGGHKRKISISRISWSFCAPRPGPDGRPPPRVRFPRRALSFPSINGVLFVPTIYLWWSNDDIDFAWCSWCFGGKSTPLFPIRRCQNKRALNPFEQSLSNSSSDSQLEINFTFFKTFHSYGIDLQQSLTIHASPRAWLISSSTLFKHTHRHIEEKIENT